jgi:putative ABC transport system ATP-binding protein
VVVTHDTLIEAVADRLVHVHDGRTIAVRAGRSAASTTTMVDDSGWTAPPIADRRIPTIPAARPDPGPPAVELDRVSRRYGQGALAIAAVEDLTWDLPRGGLTVVTGPSGSGKTTLLRLITGLDRPTSGRVTTLGLDLGSLDRGQLAELRAERLATMSQSPRLVSFLSVIENVELGLAIRGPGTALAERRTIARDALERVGLGLVAEARPDGLSGGERARLALARAIAAAPELLVLDEPTSALDRASAATVIDLLAGLTSQAVTVIVATHDRDLIAAATDRLDLRDVRRSEDQAS